MSWYCRYSQTRPIHKRYHDTEHGYPPRSERALCERLAMEIMQAGLSWDIVLKKRKAMKKAFDGFVPSRVAKYTKRDVDLLLKDASIIRNRRKIEAIIENARRLCALRKTHGGFQAWIEQHHPRRKAEWVKLFRQQFVFMGDEIVNEFLMGFGYLPGAHAPKCHVWREIEKARGTRHEARKRS